MRIILMWPDGKLEVKILLDTLTSAGHEIVYWVGEYAGEHMTPKGAIFHDHYDAWDAKPAKALAHAKIPPVSAEYIASMYETESTILTMMNKHYDAATVDERKHIYYTMLAYWTHVIDTTKPDFIVYGVLPHSIYSNIVYDLARKRGIPTICFEDTWIGRSTLAYRDFLKGSDSLRAALERLRTEKVSAGDLDEDLREYWEQQIASRSRIEPVYMTQQRNLGQGWGLFMHRLSVAKKAIASGNIFRLTAAFIARRFSENLKREYSRVSRDPEWNTPFVYFPLHFQPERTTSPQGGVYVDQVLVAETIAAALPEGWELVVKEHPSQWWLRSKERYSSARYRGYYQRLAKIPHVRIVPTTTNTFDLTEQSQAVAVITGTAGWEALLTGKCPLVFGIPWWRDCPGVLRVDSVESCKQALVAIKQGAHVTSEELLRYLKALGETSVHAYIEPRDYGTSDYTSEDNMRVLAQYICKAFHT